MYLEASFIVASSNLGGEVHIKKINNKYIAKLQDCGLKIERNLLTYLLAFLLENFPNYRSNEANFGSSRLIPEEKEAKKHLFEIYQNMYQGIKIEI